MKKRIISIVVIIITLLLIFPCCACNDKREFYTVNEAVEKGIITEDSVDLIDKVDLYDFHDLTMTSGEKYILNLYEKTDHFGAF